MKKKSKIGERIRRALELDEVIDPRDRIELRGLRELTVNGCARILFYSESEIKLSLKEYVLTIKGEELYCASFYNGAVRVDGRISALDFEVKQGGGKNAK